MDEALLAELDGDEEVQRLGRSEVLRRAAAAYLRDRRACAIADRYQHGYAASTADRDGELTGWASEGQWPDD